MKIHNEIEQEDCISTYINFNGNANSKREINRETRSNYECKNVDEKRK
jgi:hypothetical protein